tara:strand:+ start:2742 stop:3593 length:852 start_codon:yes stop_codon:yes gene_type:complete
MAKVCVASVYANDNAENQEWLDMQLYWLQKTTPKAEHFAIIMESVSDAGEAAFRDKTNVIIPDRSPLPETRMLGKKSRLWPPPCGHSHKRGMNTALNLFKKDAAKYEGFLFLDSDAFPVMPNWAGHLTKIMKTSNRGKDIAIPLRFEHIEQRLHSCILFCLPHALEHISFQHEKMPQGDLLGLNELDLTIGKYQTELRDRVFTLLNSNQHKVHPLLSMVYYNMFYHHGAGSRPATMRATNNYWDRVMVGYVANQPLLKQQKQFTERLFADAPKFINYLRGWNH